MSVKAKSSALKYKGNINSKATLISLASVTKFHGPLPSGFDFADMLYFRDEGIEAKNSGRLELSLFIDTVVSFTISEFS